MIWHFLVEMISYKAYCRHCGVGCRKFDASVKTYFYCPNPKCPNGHILSYLKELDVWKIVDSGVEVSQMTNEWFNANPDQF